MRAAITTYSLLYLKCRYRLLTRAARNVVLPAAGWTRWKASPQEHESALSGFSPDCEREILVAFGYHDPLFHQTLEQ
jgi:hypothetical protein